MRLLQPHVRDDAIAMDRFALLRYFGSGLIAGGAGVTLTMLLSAIKVHPQSYIALSALQALLVAGCGVLFWSAVRWMGLGPPRLMPILVIGGVLFQARSVFVDRPTHVVLAFSSGWWGLLVQAVMTTLFGAFFRFFAEMETDDLQYGFDHGLAIVQTVTSAASAPGEEASVLDDADNAGRLSAGRCLVVGLLVYLLRRLLGPNRPA